MGFATASTFLCFLVSVSGHTAPKPQTEPRGAGRLRELLETRDFKKLDAALEDAQAAFRRSYGAEDALRAAVAYLQLPRADYEARLDEWVSASKRPRMARLARAMHYENKGWTSRGDKYVAGTHPDAFRSMESYHAKAAEEYRLLTKTEPELILAYHGLIGISKAGGDITAVTQAVEAALKVWPASFGVRAIYLFAVTPRWGGSYPLMEDFAQTSQTMAKTNPRIRHLLGYANADRGHAAALNDDWTTAIKLYTEALAHGPEPAFLADRGQVFFYAGRLKEAVADFAEARRLSPTGGWVGDIGLSKSLLMSASAYYKMGESELGWKCLSEAEALHPASSDLPQWRASLARFEPRLRP